MFVVAESNFEIIKKIYRYNVLLSWSIITAFCISQSLRSDIDASLNHLESFSALACKLSEICDQPVQADIQRNVSELQTKLEHFIVNIDDTYRRLEQCFNQWQKLENQYRKICDWLESKENFFTKLPSRYSDPQRIPQSVIECKVPVNFFFSRYFILFK